MGVVLFFLTGILLYANLICVVRIPERDFRI